VVAALQYWRDLGAKYKVMPEGTVEWGTLLQNFTEGKTAIMWHTTGNLTAVKDSAKFPFGVSMLPASKQRGSPTGGGNFYLFKKTSPDERQPARGGGARPVPVRHARALDVPDRPREEAARRRDPGFAHRAEAAGGSAEGGADGSGEASQALQVDRKSGTDHVFRIPIKTKTWSVPDFTTPRSPSARFPPCQGGGRASPSRVNKHVIGWLLLTPAAILLIGFTHY